VLPFEDQPPPQTEERRLPVVMLALLAINVAVFLYMLTLGPGQMGDFIQVYGAVPALILGTSASPAAAPFPPIFTVLTSLFIHGGFVHLVGNMIFLWVFGDNLESALGHATFLVLYLLAGVAASLTQVLVFAASNTPTVGASGAIAGVLAGYLLLFPRAQVRVLLFFGPFLALGRVAALLVIFGWFVLQVFRGVGSLQPSPAEAGGIAYVAHVGGFLTGAAVTFAARRARHEPLGNFAGRFRWSWTFRNWLIIVIVLAGVLTLAADFGGVAGPTVRSFALSVAAAVAVVDGLLRASGRHALLGAGRGFGKAVAVIQVLLALAVLGAILL